MKTSSRFALLFASACFGLANARVQLDFTRRPGNLAKLTGRDSALSSVTGGNFIYVVNATIGTPGQPVSLVLSPSAGDTWVPDATSEYCDASYNNDDNSDGPFAETPSYCLWGSFNQSASSTYLDANQAHQSFSASYPGGGYVSGTNGTDDLRIGDIEIDDFPIGVVDYSDQWIGVLGLGSNLSSYGYQYNNFPDRLLQSGQINSKAYSIWLDDPEGTSGGVLFGAIDTSKYDGDLVRISGYAQYAYSYTFGVQVTSVNASTNATAPSTQLAWNEFPFDATIGTGETFSILPDELAVQIWALVGATYNYTIGAPVVPCNASSGGATFEIQLAGSNGPILNVNVSDLVIPAAVATGTYAWQELMGTPGTCLFAVRNGSGYSSNYYNLGGPLLRRSYLVFDLPNEEVAIAQTRFDNRPDPVVVEFASYGATIPSATMYGAHPSSTSSYGDGSNDGGSYDGDSDDSGNSADTSAAIGLSVTFGVITLVGAVAAVFVWRGICCAGRRAAKGKDVEMETRNPTPPGTEAPEVAVTPEANLPVAVPPAVPVAVPPTEGSARQRDAEAGSGVTQPGTETVAGGSEQGETSVRQAVNP